MLTELPSTLTIKGKKYVLSEVHYSEHAKVFPNGWSYSYEPIDHDNLPAWVHNKREWYFLCTIADTKEDAYTEMLGRVSTMIDD